MNDKQKGKFNWAAVIAALIAAIATIVSVYIKTDFDRKIKELEKNHKAEIQALKDAHKKEMEKVKNNKKEFETASIRFLYILDKWIELAERVKSGKEKKEAFNGFDETEADVKRNFNSILFKLLDKNDKVEFNKLFGRFSDAIKRYISLSAFNIPKETITTTEELREKFENPLKDFIVKVIDNM